MTLAKKTPEETNSVSSDINLSDITYEPQGNNGGLNATIVATSHTEIVKGPLPHPQLLAEYDKLIPNGAERIMTMAERQQSSRIEGEKETREVNKLIACEEIKLQKRGQWIALSVICLIFCFVALFTFTGHETVAIVTLGIGIASILGVFVGAAGLKKKSEN